MRFLVKVKPEDKDKVKELGEIIYESRIINGLFSIESDLHIKEIRLKSFIISAEIPRLGNLCGCKPDGNEYYYEFGDGINK